MIYQIFFVACMVTIFAVTILIRKKKESWLLGIVGFIIGLAIELWGTSNGSWSYDDVTSLLMVFDIPIEILMGYFTAGFLLTALLMTLYAISDEPQRKKALDYVALPSVGIILLIYCIWHRSTLLPGLIILGIWGVSISKRPSIPLIVGVLALVADFIVEGLILTNHTEYYISGWSISIGLQFMLTAMAITGLLTSWKCPPNKDFCFYELEE